MSETKFTPGPWIWGDNYCGLYGAGPNNQVLDFYHGEGMSLGYSKYMEANANLIAAAPKLYKTLEKLLDYAEDSLGCQYGTLNAKMVKEMAEEALAKARGEQ